MRFSRNWLAAYTELPELPEFVDDLSMLGWVVDDASPRGDDISFDLDMPSNRPDALNHLMLARELAVKRGVAVAEPPADFSPGGAHTEEVAGLQIDDPSGCRRFVARALLDVKVGPSPAWMVERLESIGLRPINNVVDVTNYVMWEMGRPLHAYDLDLVAEHRLIVRRAAAGEIVVTLDEVERELTGEDLVIADASGAIGLAGVMGGISTSVTDSTRRVLLECACFDPVTIRRMARRHGMHTDASHRFERGMSTQDIGAAVDRACHLLREQATISASALDARGEETPATRIRLPRQRLHAYLGIELEGAWVVGLLESLGFGVVLEDDTFDVQVPARRVDISLDVDLIEEIVRFHGYDRLPDTLPTLRKRDSDGPEPPLRAERRLKDVCAALGYWEAMTFAFGSAEEQARFLPADTAQVGLVNPLSEALGVMRSALVPGLLTALARNHNRGGDQVRLFEVGRAFRPADEGDERPIETRRLAIAGFGAASPPHYTASRDARALDFADLKGTLEALATRLHWPSLAWSAATAPGYADGATAEIAAAGAGIGVCGRIDPAIAATFGLDVPVWAAEVEVESFLGAAGHEFEVVPLPRYPASERDVSLLIGSEVEFAAVRERVAEAQEETLESLRLLDLFSGGDVPEGSVAMTLRLTYRAADRTLTAEEIETAHDRIVGCIEQGLGATRR